MRNNILHFENSYTNFVEFCNNKIDILATRKRRIPTKIDRLSHTRHIYNTKEDEMRKNYYIT